VAQPSRPIPLQRHLRAVLLPALIRLVRVVCVLFPNLVCLALALGLLAGWGGGPAWVTQAWPGLAALWLAATVASDRRLQRRIFRRWGRRGIKGLALAFALFALLWWLRDAGPTTLAQAAVVILAGLCSTPVRRLFTAAARTSRSPRGEILRWVAVFAVAGFAIQPYGTRQFVGAGDAFHYAQQIADATAQVRAGIFPILAGQSAYAFNGDFHPLRTAPYFQYAGVAIDQLTGGRLGPAGVQNLLIVLSLLAAVVLTYLLVLRLGGSRLAWFACLFAGALATSPGVLALIYSGDMVASWMTLPFIPVLYYALLRASQAEDPAPHLRIAAATYAMIWLGHAAIAFWLSPLVGLSLANGILRRPDKRHGFWTAAGVAALVLVLAAYVFASVAGLGLPDDPNLLKVVRQGAVLASLRAGAAGFLRPVDPSGTDLLRNLQLSPVLWGALIIGLVGIRVARKDSLPFWVYTGLLLMLLIPSGVSGAIWAHVPAAVIGATEKWPMQRFYPVLSCLVPFLAIAGMHHRWFRPAPVRWAVALLLFAGCAYSTVEARKFRQRGSAITNSPDFTVQRFRPENALLSRYSVEYLGRQPRYFSGGVMSPELETRLLARDTLELLQSNRRAASQAGSAAIHAVERTDYGLRFNPKVRLEPGRKYVVRLNLGPNPPEGTLVLDGRTIYRQYPVGAGTENRAERDVSSDARSFLLWTTGPGPDDVETRYHVAPGQAAWTPAGRLEVFAFEPATAPIWVEGLLPYRVSIESPGPGWLETPKLMIPGYAATVNGQAVPVSRSPDNLVMIPVEAGRSDIQLAYPGPWFVRAAFWISALAWVAFLVNGFLRRPAGSTAALARLGQVGLAGILLAGLGLGVARLLAYPPLPPLATAAPGFASSVILPLEKEGTAETFATTRTAAGEEIALRFLYASGQELVLELHRDGRPWLTSEKINVHYLLAQELVVYWGSAPEAIRVELNHQLALAGSREQAGAGPAAAAAPAAVFSGRILRYQPTPTAGR
jgi:hypothetical protein